MRRGCAWSVASPPSIAACIRPARRRRRLSTCSFIGSSSPRTQTRMVTDLRTRRDPRRAFRARPTANFSKTQARFGWCECARGRIGFAATASFGVLARRFGLPVCCRAPAFPSPVKGCLASRNHGIRGESAAWPAP